MLHRAYSLLDVKEIAEGKDEHVISGIASTPTPDRYKDVVDPMGAKYALPMPLLWQHNHEQPVGRVEFAKPTKKGIPFRASLPIVKEAGRLKDRIDEAIQSIKYRLVGAVSIGFRAEEDDIENLDTGGYLFKRWEWLELSLVTIPANAEASIQTIKSLDSKARAASGKKRAPAVRLIPSPGVPGSKSAASRGFVKLTRR